MTAELRREELLGQIQALEQDIQKRSSARAPDEVEAAARMLAEAPQHQEPAVIFATLIVMVALQLACLGLLWIPGVFWMLFGASMMGSSVLRMLTARDILARHGVQPSNADGRADPNPSSEI